MFYKHVTSLCKKQVMNFACEKEEKGSCKKGSEAKSCEEEGGAAKGST